MDLTWRRHHYHDCHYNYAYDYDYAQVIIYDRCMISNQSNTSKCPPKIEWVLVNQTIQNCASGSAALESGLVSTNMNAQTAVFAIPPANTIVGPCISAG